MYTEEKLLELQKMSLDEKIQLSKIRIIEFVEHYKGGEKCCSKFFRWQG